MKTRVAAATLKRLAAIEHQREQRHARRKVLKLPAILDYDSWQAIAIPTLQALAAAAAEDIAFVQPNAATTAPPMPSFHPTEGMHFHRPDPNRNQAPVPRPPRAAKVYE